MDPGFVRVVCVSRPDSLIKSRNFDSRKGLGALISQTLQTPFDLFLSLRLERLHFYIWSLCRKVVTGICVALKQARLTPAVQIKHSRR